ncbi:conserved hypothetical protein [Acinetobacter proteolyticus]|uniref:Baseplate structural protein Gp10 C-terminal domain-containing protein n=1 Tax=Acinetobacter proteolyticus TaxID=1776741 RepID=A0A653K1P8_9GAMM|nr:hypothetical protein [Acinetobacter proteolyticus]VXA54665.1 conserved hypothetical protein [Acinetobacter proteolyticus]
MKRIDSVNARPNVNGAGKTGFHDNNDISGQDATYLTPDWLNHIQEELCALLEKNGRTLNAGQRDQLFQLLATEDDVLALAAATQLKIDAEASTRATADNQLSQRISTLEIFAGALIDRIYPVGIIIEFAADVNPNSTLAGTTWVRHGEGKASVGLSTQENDPVWTKTIGSTFGSYTHTLTVEQLPPHNHNDGAWDSILNRSGTQTYINGDNTVGEPDLSNVKPMSNIGGGEAHNNVQPSIVDLRWRRTA